MPRTPKREFWAVDGTRYGRCSTFVWARDFLTRIYNVTKEEDEDHAFYEEWKAEHPLSQFLADEQEKVERHWYRYSFEGGELYLVDAKPGTRGAFELWEWRR